MPPTPTLYEWAGGHPALIKLTTTFYTDKVPKDPLLAPVFAEMDPDHPTRVADFLGEVLGGPPAYTETHGGHKTMVTQHIGRNLTEAQRKRWLNLLLETADEIGLPSDPEFRSALISYLEWGSRLAVINSQTTTPPAEDAPMPKWGWGEVKGPYQP
jgi:hemoglobin